METGGDVNINVKNYVLHVYPPGHMRVEPQISIHTVSTVLHTHHRMSLQIYNIQIIRVVA